jgi:hypothetical protein
MLVGPPGCLADSDQGKATDINSKTAKSDAPLLEHRQRIEKLNRLDSFKTGFWTHDSSPPKWRELFSGKTLPSFTSGEVPY